VSEMGGPSTLSMSTSLASVTDQAQKARVVSEGPRGAGHTLGPKERLAPNESVRRAVR